MAFLQILFKIRPVVVFSWLAFLGSLYFISLKSYVLFHSIAELLSIVVAAGIFMLAWNSRRFFDNHYLLFLSIAFVFAAMIDVVHTLAYKGMGVFNFFDSTSNLATQLWISARYVQAASFFVAPVFLIKKIRPVLALWVYGLVTFLFFLSIFYWKIFPAAYIEGFGLTQFKIISEYVISLMLAVSAFFLFRERKFFDKTVFKFVFFSILATVGSELFFTTYFGVYDFSNMAGHLLKIVAFYFLYKAIIETGIKNPQDFIFHNLEEGARALKESEKQLDLAIKGSEGGLWRLDFDKDDPSDFNKGYLYISPELKKFVGYEEMEFPNSRRAWAERILPEDLEKLNNVVSGYLSGKIQKYGIEYRIRHKNNSWRWLNSFARVETDERGKLVRLVGIAWDITERKETEEALKQSEKNFRMFLQLNVEAVVVANSQGKVAIWNESAEKIFGYKEKEILGQLETILMPERFRKMHLEGVKRVNSGGESNMVGKTIETVGLRKNSQEFPMELSLSSWETNQGKFYGAIIHDITDRKKLHENLARHAENLEKLNQDLLKFHLAIENASDHIIITDENGVILYANKAAGKITGFSLKEIIGNNPSLWGKQMPSDFYQKLWSTIKEEKKPFSGEMTNKRKNSELYPAEIKVSPILNELGEVKFFVGIERDISEQKEFDKAKTEFISLAAHQLRTPLTTISLAAEILLRGSGGKIPKEGRGYLKEIFMEVKDMALLIETFLNVSRIEMDRFPVNPEPASLFAVIEKSANNILPQIKNKKLRLEKEYGKDLPVLDLDEKVMDIILSNLLSNSVKYTLKGFIKIKAKKRKNDILIEISDTGIGIPRSQQDKIFAKMFRADNVKNIKSEGSGLGLFVVKSLVEQSGGKIWFESKENKGTSFFVSLPKEGMKENQISFR